MLILAWHARALTLSGVIIYSPAPPHDALFPFDQIKKIPLALPLLLW
jgi:hypothetical protein